jgi:hypothetical protein
MTKFDRGFRFKTNKLRRCIAHALNAREHRDFDLKPVNTATLYVVRDQANCVYIASSGWPRDVMSNGKPYVAYAEHCKMIDSINDTSGKYICRVMPDDTVGVLGAIPLYVAENGYAFEECMLDMYKEFVFVPRQTAQTYFTDIFADATRKAQQFDRRNETGGMSDTPTKTSRRILKTAHNN